METNTFQYTRLNNEDRSMGVKLLTIYFHVK